jgi:hypothetical protein
MNGKDEGRSLSGMPAAKPRPALARAAVTAVLTIPFILFPAVCLSLAGSARANGAAARKTTLSLSHPLLDAEREAVDWLKGRMVPNDTVPAPDPGRRRLLLSYRVPKEDPVYPHMSGKSFVYDDALAAVALAMAGQYREAEYILTALKRLVREDGSLWFVYNTRNDWPSEGDREGATVRTGAVAWVGYAFTYYLRARLRDDGGFLGRDPLASGFLKTAESIAGFLLENRVEGGAGARDGLVTGGLGSYALVVPPGASKPEESYDGKKVRWVSTEHNIDAYFFLRDLGELSGEGRYAGAAERIGERLMGLWSGRDSQFYQGVFESGELDAALPLDGASWGALFLFATGREGHGKSCLEAMEGRFRSKSDGFQGYRPYSFEAVYENDQVGMFFFPGATRTLWRDLNFVWGEGSFGAASAFIRGGEREKALGIVESLLALRDGGGFRYASITVPYLFNDYPSVASTAWFVIAVEMLKGGDAGASFWDR